MRIGLDFDNTLASYEDVFAPIAKRDGFVADDFIGGKRETRDAVRASSGGERSWMALQGRVYGRYMPAAHLFPGVEMFLHHCRKSGARVFIISHKTLYGHYDEQKVDLRNAALTWMTEHGFFDPDIFAIDPNDVTFTTTREEKIDCIRALDVDIFIDDLEEVLNHPNFPTKTQRIHFDPTGQTHNSNWPCFAHWQAITDKVFPLLNTHKSDPEDLARRLLKSHSASVELIPQGGNNALYKVTDGDQCSALKIYADTPLNARNRRECECRALTFLKTQCETHVPQVIAQDPAQNAALFSWIEGNPIDTIGDADLVQSAEFIARLFQARHHAQAATLGLASEACLSGHDLLEQVGNRIKRLVNVSCLHPGLESFLKQTLAPAFADEKARFEENREVLLEPISTQDRRISPSDFGFHNALRLADGTLTFLDFEYFGWDDPVKLVADFLLHPAMTLSAPQKQLFLHTLAPEFVDIPHFAKRLRGHYHMYALRWCTIILNPFIARLRTTSRHADPQQIEALQSTRLKRAKAMYTTIFLEERSFPYVL